MIWWVICGKQNQIKVVLWTVYLCEVVYGVGGLSGICRRGRKFCGLGIQGQPGGYSVRNMFEVPFTEEGKGAGQAIFDEGFKFSASDSRKKFDSTASAVHIEEDQSTYPPTHQNKKLEGKLKHRVKWSMIQPGSYQGLMGA